MKDLKLALLGFGNAGQAFAEMLTDKKEAIREKYGCGVIVTAISTNSKGTVVNAEGIDLRKAVDDVRQYGKFAEDTKGLCEMSSFDVIEKADCDAVCELTTLNIATGQPAIDHIKTAFNCGKHVVSANKGPIAWAYDELSTIAENKKLMFFYETTVMDGTPVFNLVEHTLKFCRVTEVSGILNSTTNYILEELARGKDYDSVIEAGKKRGFIEADPAMDIDGYDAAAKVTALLNVLMKAGITPPDVDVTGVGNIVLEDIKDAASRGKVIKLLCRGAVGADGKVKAFVRPEEVDKGDMLAAIDSTTSIVSITTDLMGKISIVEHVPELEQTAYGIFGDVIRLLDGMK